MKTILSVALLLLLSGALISCAAPEREEMDVAQVRQAIEDVNAKFSDFVRQGDAAGIASLYTEDAVLLAPNRDMVRGREAIEKAMKGVLDMGAKDLSLTTVDVGGSGDIAYEVGRYVMTLQPADHQSIQDVGKYVVVWKKGDDGQWQLHVDIWNSSQPMVAAMK